MEIGGFMYCFNCGKLLSDNANFCSGCGAKQNPNANMVVSSNRETTETRSRLRNIEIMLESGQFQNAFNKCNELLDLDPENATIYLYMLMADKNISTRKDLSRLVIPFDNNEYYKMAMRFGDDNLKAELKEDLRTINSYLEINQKNPKVGSSYYFGSINGNKIWWKVQKIERGLALLICREVLFELPFNIGGKPRSWEDTTLRKWLNNDFIQKCFSPQEASRIAPVINNNNERNPVTGMGAGFRTNDKVFVLSYSEVNSYFNSCTIGEKSAGRWYWLRTAGADNGNTVNKMFVDANGDYDFIGLEPGSDCGVRPVLWIKLV